MGANSDNPSTDAVSKYAEQIVTTLREPLVVLDADLRIISTSRAFYQTFQLLPEQTIGQLIYEVGEGEWKLPELKKLLLGLLPRDGEITDFAIDQIFPRIGWRSLLVNARRLHDGGELPPMILLAMEDITERKRAEEAVREQRQWFEVTLSSIGDAVIATDPEARVTFMNPTAERMTGWSKADALRQPLGQVFNIVNEDTRNLVESPVNKAIRMGSIVGLANHTVLIGRDGTETPIDDSAAPIRDEHGGIAGVVMVFHDIAERREAERKIERSESRYRRLFEAAQDGILILDARDGKILDANRFVMELLRYPRDFFIGKRLPEIGMFDDTVANEMSMTKLSHEKFVRYEDLPLRDSDGREVPVEFVSNVYKEDGQQVIQCNIRDIRIRKQLEREREAVLAQEHAARVEAQAGERANRSKDLFLATLSHEMRTPLTAIMGWSKMLLTRPGMDPEIRKGVEVIERNARAQAKLIDDVLDVSRIVSGKFNMEIAPCQLTMVISAAIDAVRHAAEAKDITITTDLDTSADETDCDAARIQQVVWNLLSNAIKFSPPKGTIRISLRRELSQSVIRVFDTGQGIAPEFLPYVFDRFRQADSTTRRKFGGLGLGLSIVKHLVEMHGGQVDVQSAGENKGSTFTIKIPFRAVPSDHTTRAGALSSEMKAAIDVQPIRLEGLRVAVIDDDQDARDLLTLILTKAGAIVQSAASADQAMTLLETFKPDIWVSDIGLPDTDGYDLIRQVRSAHSAKDLPAIALTAFAQREDYRRAMLAGFQVHVTKPVDPHDLTAIIASLASRTGGHAGKSART